jgi:hypothetical protein
LLNDFCLQEELLSDIMEIARKSLVKVIYKSVH